jgi:multiple sugar transport system permease protein
MTATATPHQAASARTEPARRPKRPAKSRLLTLAMLAFLIYFLLPLFWLVVASTKDSGDLFNTFGLWFGHDFHFLSNVRRTFTYNDGVYGRWLLNTLFYAVASAGGAAVLATLGGYGFAKFRFPGNSALFATVLGAVMVPTTALAIPTFVLFAKIDLTNTPWAIILPSLSSPFGLYLMRVYAQDAIPDSLLEAARIDGAGELRIFLKVVLRLLAPGVVTVLLFTLVATWNNYFLPLIMLSEPKLYPVTVGLSQWQAESAAGGGGSTGGQLPLVLTGALLSVIPLVAAFLMLQRYWQSGLTAGGIKQ